MIQNILLAKYKVAESLLNSYANLYWYRVDVYMVDESLVQRGADDVDYDLYLDYLRTKYKSLPRVTIPVRFIATENDVEGRDWSFVLGTGFRLGILDKVLRDNNVSLRVGDVIATSRILDQVMEHQSFDVFSQPVFVRIVQTIVPHTYVVSGINVMEWEVMVSDRDVVFRYFV